MQCRKGIYSTSLILSQCCSTLSIDHCDLHPSLMKEMTHPFSFWKQCMKRCWSWRNSKIWVSCLARHTNFCSEPFCGPPYLVVLFFVCPFKVSGNLFLLDLIVSKAYVPFLSRLSIKSTHEKIVKVYVMVMTMKVF